MWKVFWPQCHTERAFTEQHAFGRSGFPFTSKEYADPSSVDYSKVEVPNARWHEAHTFTCFAFPTFGEDGHGADRRRHREGRTALLQVIRR